MRTLGGYKTKQREQIEDCLKTLEGKHFTADELFEVLEKSGMGVGRTTVYRTLERLEGEGKIRKYSAESGQKACYQYLKDGECCHEHFHLKCESCGKLIHVECESINDLCHHMKQDHKFAVNRLKTVLYGVCEECQKK